MPGKRRKKKPDDIRHNYQERLAQRCARNAQRRAGIICRTMDERKAGIRCRRKEERKSRILSGITTKKGSCKDAREMHRGARRDAGGGGKEGRVKKKNKSKNRTRTGEKPYVMVTRWSREWTVNGLTEDLKNAWLSGQALFLGEERCRSCRASRRRVRRWGRWRRSERRVPSGREWSNRRGPSCSATRRLLRQAS